MTPDERRGIVRQGFEIVVDKTLERLGNAMGRRMRKKADPEEVVFDALASVEETLQAAIAALKSARADVDDDDLSSEWKRAAKMLKGWLSDLDEIELDDEGSTLSDFEEDE